MVLNKDVYDIGAGLANVLLVRAAQTSVATIR